MSQMKHAIKKIPLIGNIVKNIAMTYRMVFFPGSQKYWERRYRKGQTSGCSSYGKYAEFKAEVLNQFVKEHKIKTVLEFGCGDGNQLSLSEYPEYIGLDVSREAVKICMERFKGDHSKSFFLYNPECFQDNYGLLKADLVLSLDVLFHLVEDSAYSLYMNNLFNASTNYVIIYSSNYDEIKQYAAHVKRRNFTEYVKNNYLQWKLIQKIQNKYILQEEDRDVACDFFIYEKV